MKRIAIMTAALLAATTTFGQERRWSLDYHAGLGLTRFVNYPALSAIEDRTPSYTGLTASFTLALKRDDGFALGLRYRNTEVATAAVSLREEATVHDVSLLVRHSTMVTPRLELHGSATMGLAILHNSMVSHGNELTFNRYGISAGLEAGLRYYMTEEMYLSFDLGIGGVSTFKKALDIPNDQLPQNRHSWAAVHALGGFGIGLRPKVRKLRMPQQLIDQSEPLQLARYEE